MSDIGNTPIHVDPIPDDRALERARWWMVAALLAAVCCGVAAALAGSWLLAIAAVLFMAYAVRIGVVFYRDAVDRRRFGDFGDTATRLAQAGDYEELQELARSIIDDAASVHFSRWGLEWAAYGAILARNEEQMRRLLAEALRRGSAPHIPAQLHDGLGEFDYSLSYWEVAVLEPGGEAAVPGLIHSLVAVGETERAHRVIERAFESHPSAEIVEWRVWSLLERNDVDGALGTVEGAADMALSPWGLHVFQTATLRAGHHELSIEFGNRALMSDGNESIIDTVRYNRACSCAQLGDIATALADLGSLGDPDLLTHAATDPDLAPLHPSPEFRTITGGGAAP